MTEVLRRGQKVPLDTLTPSTKVRVGIELESDAEWDVTCFGLDEAGALSDDRWFVFFNQPVSPEDAITLDVPTGDADLAAFRVGLELVPESIHTLMFCVSLDGVGTAAEIVRGRLHLMVGGVDVAAYAFTGADFTTERAVMVASVYRRGGRWRVAADGQGFAGGLAELLVSFGGEVIEDEPEAAAPPPNSPPEPEEPASYAAVDILRKHLVVEQPGRWAVPSAGLVRVGLGADVYARRGSMVAYRGEVDFSHKGSGGLKAVVESKLTGQALPLMRCSGTGEVFFADDAADVHVVELGAHTLCVTAANVLAFDETVDVSIHRLESPALAGGVLYYLQLAGTGSVAITSKGPPLALPVDRPTFADVNATIAWTAGMRVSVASEVRLVRPGQRGGSAEATPLQFTAVGGGHTVVVQPHETGS